MNKFTLLSLVTATLLFTGCGEDAKKAVTDAAASASETISETASNAVDATKEAAASVASTAKEKAAEAVEATKVEAERLAATAAEKAAEVKKAAEDKAAAAADALKERAAAATQAAKETASSAVASAKEAVTPDNAAGKAAFAKCAGCHGADGKTQALGKSAVIAGQAASALVDAINGYKAGTRNVSGMGMLMKGQVGSMDDATIKAVAEYISGL